MKKTHEVKLRRGRFLPYGKVDPNKTIIELALEYVADPSHADIYDLSAVRRGSRGGHAGCVLDVEFTREAVYAALLRYRDNPAQAPALAVHNGGVALMRVEYSVMRRTFGVPYDEFPTQYAKIDDIVPDPADFKCNAPYARKWEKECARVAGGKWHGALNNVQTDFIVNEADD